MQVLLTIAIILTTIIALMLAFWKFYFLRNPTPNIPKEKNIILAPGEGVIARIVPFKNKLSQTVEKGLFGKIQIMTNDVAKEGYLILIRLHVYNIHYQRAPIRGTIENISYTYGRFLNAVKDPQNLKCLFQNERNEILIKGSITCKVVQIAGYLARRIECFVNKKQRVELGQELGLINLGSQCAIIIPKCTLHVKEGQKIKVGETVIATYG